MKHVKLLVFIFILCSTTTKAADYYWVSAGASNWNNIANWALTSGGAGGAGGAGVLGAADVAIFNANGLGNCTIDMVVNVNGLTVNGYTSTIDLAGFNFTSTGTNTLATGTINDTPNTGSFNINSPNNSIFSGTTFGASVYVLSARLFLNGSTFNNIAYLEKTGAVNDQSIGGNTFAMDVDVVNSGSGYFMLGNGTFDVFSANVTLNNTGSNGMYLTYAGAGHSIVGNLIATNTGTANSFIRIGELASSTLTVNGDVTLTNNGTGVSITYLSLDGSLTVNGNVTLTNAGTGTASEMRIAHGTNSSVTIAGTTTVTNNSTATNSRMFIGNAGDITFNGSLDIINNSGSVNSEIFCNYSVNSTNLYNENITLQTTNATSDGIRFGQNGGFGTLAATKTVTIGVGGFIAGQLWFRNFTQTGNTTHAITLTRTALFYNYDANWGGDVTFIAPQILTRGTTYNRTAYLEKTGAVNDASLGGNTFSDDVIFQNTGTGYFMTANIVANTFLSNATYKKLSSGLMYPTYNVATIYPGDINIDSNTPITFGASTNGRVIFQGAANQQINDLGTSATPIFRRLTTNKTAGDVTLNLPIDISTELNLVAGNIISSATNLLAVYDNAMVSSVSNAAYVDGPVRKIGNDAFSFPIGKGGFYRPASISAPTSTVHHFTAEYFLQSPNILGFNILLKEATINHVSGCEYWIIDRTNGTSNVNVTLSWNTTSCGVTNLPDLIVASWDGSGWKDHGNGGTTGNNAAGTVVTSGVVTAFSPFTLASTTAANPLPITLTSFNAYPKENEVILTWETASEINNDFFTVERSTDLVNWEIVLTTKGAGNSNHFISYLEKDNAPLEGLSYYRLKQTDFDGQFEYFNIVPVTFNKTAPETINFYPNPIKRGETLNVLFENPTKKEILVVMIDVSGREVYSKMIIKSKDGQLFGFPIEKNIPTGIYFITATSDNQIYNRKIVVE